MASTWTFDERRYLLYNADVRAEVASGRLRTGREHFELHGRVEGRKGFWIRPRDQLVAPQEGRPDQPPLTTGRCVAKPWDYEVTVAIPHHGSADNLELLVEMLRVQTIRPFIQIIDTGSRDADLSRVRRLRAEDCEVHEMALTAVPHPDDQFTLAMDFAFASCRTRHLFATTANYLPRQQEMLAWYRSRCTAAAPVVCMADPTNPHDTTPKVLNLTAAMYHVATLMRYGFNWTPRAVRPRPAELVHMAESDEATSLEQLVSQQLREREIKPIALDVQLADATNRVVRSAARVAFDCWVEKTGAHRAGYWLDENTAYEHLLVEPKGWAGKFRRWLTNSKRWLVRHRTPETVAAA